MHKYAGNTIQITDDFVYIAQYKTHCIMKYSHDGKLASIIASEGTAMGKVKHPRLCGADRDGNVLIADMWNQRFQVLSSKGKWKSLPMDSLNYSCCAVIEDEIIYVVQGPDVGEPVDQISNKQGINLHKAWSTRINMRTDSCMV